MLPQAARLTSLAVVVVLYVVRVAAAQDCVVRGSVETPDGQKVAGVTVTATRTRMFRSSGQTATSNADGTFVFAAAPCGKLRVWAGTAFPVDFDSRSKTPLTLRVPRTSGADNDVLRDLREAQASRGRELTAEERADEQVAAHYRATVVAAVGAPEDKTAFASATTPDAQAQVFVMAVARWVAAKYAPGGVAPNAESAPRDSIKGRLFDRLKGRGPAMPAPVAPVPGTRSKDDAARRRLADVRAFVAANLPAADAAAFDAGTPRERTRTSLVAARTWLSAQIWPTLPVLFMTDASFGTGAKKVVREVLGDDSREVREWDQHLSPRWRGDVYRSAYLQLLDDAIDFSEGKPASPALSSQSERGRPATGDDLALGLPPEMRTAEVLNALTAQNRAAALGRDLELIVTALGPSATEGYEKKPEAQQKELRGLATAATLAQSVIVLVP